MSARNNPRPGGHGEAWYQQPILWFGAAIFAALLAGCVWMIVVSARHADTPLDAPHAVLGVPASTHSTPPPSP